MTVIDGVWEEKQLTFEIKFNARKTLRVFPRQIFLS
jgi:hypothetical protein